MAITDTTPNYALPLPHSDNIMAEDAMRIRQALQKTDAELKNLADKANAALPKSGGGILNGRYTITDGAVPLALKNPYMEKGTAPDSGYVNSILRYTDKDDQTLGSLTLSHSPSVTRGALYLRMVEHKAGSSLSADLGLGTADDGGSIYAFCPPPRQNNYGSDIVNMKAMKDHSPKKLTGGVDLFVGGAGASDTIGLFVDRGFSAEKPFASFDAAVAYACTHLSGPWNVNINLQEDAIWNNTINNQNLYRLVIMSRNNSTLTIGGDAALVRNGNVGFSNITLNGNNVKSIFRAEGGWCSPIINIGSNVTVNGSVTEAVCCAGWNGKILISGASIAGNITGMRYKVSNGSSIITGGKGPTAIPGTKDGTCDASSIYA